MRTDAPRIPEIQFPELDAAYSDSICESYKKRKHRRGTYELACLGFHQRIFPSGEILDVCCGVGDITSYLAIQSPDRQVTGIDNDSENIRKGNEVIQLPNLSLRVGNAYELEQFAGRMAVATSIMSLHHLDNLGLAIEQAANTLVPNGLLYILDFGRLRTYNVDTLIEEDDLYRMRQDLTEDEFRTQIRELVDFQDPTSMQTIFSLFSHMAGYTCDEVIDAIERQNLIVISRSNKMAEMFNSNVSSRYDILAKKFSA